MLMPSLLPRTQMPPPTEGERLVLQSEQELKRQELEARELEVERRTRAPKLQKLQELFQNTLTD